MTPTRTARRSPISRVPLIGHLVDGVRAYGFTRRVEPTDNPGLRRIEAPGLVGVEDITVDHDRGIAYLSAADRRTRMSGGPEHGALFRYDLADPEAAPRRLSAPDEGIFPHGIAFWTAPDGRRELWAVDHARDRHTIRRYAVDHDGLRLLRVYADPLIHSPNDLTVAGDGDCYVTNDHGFRSPIAQTVEQFAGLPVSDVVRVRDTGSSVSYSRALTRVPFANGIAFHPRRADVFVAAMTRREVWRCRVEEDGRLRREAVFPTGMCVDNIEVDHDGALWIGGHPRPYRFPGHARDPRSRCDSQVIRMDPDSGAQTTVFEDDGTVLSGCSVAVRWRDRVLVGSVFEPFVIGFDAPS